MISEKISHLLTVVKNYSYDISKLYTNIPHDLLIENMKFVIEEAFKIKEDSEFIKINKKSARIS